MIEEFLARLGELTPFWVYVALFFFSYIENVFPPSPSDLVVLIGGTLISGGTIYFIPTLLLTSVGSILGFMTLYYLGAQLDKKVLRAGKIKFISIEALEKAERWFNRWGYYVILANRFMPGTRSVISFFAGVTELNVKRTVILAFISTLAWNTIILILGITFRDNIQVIDEYLSTYSNIIMVIAGVIIVVFVIRYFIKKKKKIEP